MMDEFKMFDGQALGSDKIGESSVEGGEKIGEIPIPPQTIPMNKFAPKPNHLRNKLNTTPDPPVFPHKTDNFQKLVKFVSTLRNTFEGKSGEKEVEKRKGRVVMHFAHLFRLIQGNVLEVWLDGVDEVWVESCDEVIVGLLLARMREDGPGQIVDVPGMLHVNVGETEGDRALRF